MFGGGGAASREAALTHSQKRNMRNQQRRQFESQSRERQRYMDTARNRNRVSSDRGYYRTDTENNDEYPYSYNAGRKERYSETSGTSYPTRMRNPSRHEILDSDAFLQPPQSSERNRRINHKSRYHRNSQQIPHFDSLPTYEMNDGTRIRYRDSKYEYEDDNNNNDNIYNDYSYDIGTGDPARNEIEDRNPNHKYETEETPFFGSLFNGMSSLNPMNLFQSSDKESSETDTISGRSRYGTGKRPYQSNWQNERWNRQNRRQYYAGSPSPNDYSDGYSSDTYESNEIESANRPDFNTNSGHFGRPSVNGKRNSYRRSQFNNKRRYQQKMRNHRRVNQEVPTISVEEVLFERSSRPRPPLSYDPRRISTKEHRLESVRDAMNTNQVGFRFRNRNSFDSQSFNNRKQGAANLRNPQDMFNLNIPSSEIKYENIPMARDDPRLDAFKYKEDFPLREDLYVGKDGNIYMKGSEDETVSASARDSDSLLGLQMYGMEHPLYQEVSQSRIHSINSKTPEEELMNSKRSRNLLQMKPKTNLYQMSPLKTHFQNDMPRLKTTAHRRPPTGKPAMTTQAYVRSDKQFRDARSEASTGAVYDFGKTLVKVDKPAQLSKYTYQRYGNLKD